MVDKNTEETDTKRETGADRAAKGASVENAISEGPTTPKLEEAQESALTEGQTAPKLEDSEARERKTAREVENLKRTLEEKDSVIKDYETLLKKIQAEFDNYRKRIEREREDYSKFVVEKLVRKIVTIIDDMDRGLSETRGNGDFDAFRIGMEKIRNNTMQVLVEEGLKEIPTGGKFDPYYHEAIVVEESPDYDDNQITEVYQKGFTIGGKVLRPAKVRVSRSPSKKGQNDKERSEV